MRNVTPKGKLDDKWEKEPFLVIEIPNEDIPVYRLKRENGKGPVKTLHRNLLLPLNYIPYTVDPVGSPKPRKLQDGNLTMSDRGHLIETNDEETSSSSDSETDTEYVQDPRPKTRRHVIQHRLEHPANFSHVGSEGHTSSSSSGRSSLHINNQNDSSFRNSVSTRQTSQENNEINFSDTSTQESISINPTESLRETPERPARPQRIKRPPDRYGNWVAPISAKTDFPLQDSTVYYV